jgi:uncharacterized protein (DUF58 family)
MTDTRLAPARRAAPVRPFGRLPFAFGPTTFWLLGAGLILLIPAWFDRRALAAMLAWDAAVLTAAMLELRQLPAAPDLALERRWGGILTLGDPSTVTIGVTWRAQPFDHSCPALRDGVAVLPLTPGQPAEASYEIVPRERGNAAAGVATIRWQGARRLAERRGIASLEQIVRVYPAREEGRLESWYLLRSRQIALEKRRAKHAGAGRDFESLRDHQQGDEPRDICWSAAARRGRLVTKLYQPERSQTVWVLVDAGRLGRTRTGAQTMLDRAVTGALTIAQVATNAGDKVGLIAYGRRIQHRLAPSRGGPHLRQWLEALADVRAEAVEASHAKAAGELLRLQRRRALVIWLTEISETAGTPEVIEQSAAMLPRHVVLFAVPRHLDLLSTAAAIPQSAQDMYRTVAAQETLERRDALLAGLRRKGALVLEATPSELGGGLVDRYLEVKERGLF